MTKIEALAYPDGSAERVIAHALYQKSRGRKPSMAYRGILNPIAALKAARESQTTQETTGLPSTANTSQKIILVWNELQKVPATIYGNAHFGEGKFRIQACKNPNIELAQLGKENAVIYHFA